VNQVIYIIRRELDLNDMEGHSFESMTKDGIFGKKIPPLINFISKNRTRSYFTLRKRTLAKNQYKY
jgi:hypothetical protein